MVEWLAAILSASGFFMSTSRTMEYRKYGFILCFLGSCAWLILVPVPAFWALSIVYAVASIIGFCNNYSWRKS